MADPTGNTGYLSEMDIRIWLRDVDPAANLLIQDWEFGQEEIRTASTLAVDYWNEAPPCMSGYWYTLYTFPFRYHLLMATCANLLFIAANLYRRNRLPYNIPGGGVDDQAKAPDYDAAGDKLWAQYKDWTNRKKREFNTNLGWGRI
jgi:hypothetical protein